MRGAMAESACFCATSDIIASGGRSLLVNVAWEYELCAGRFAAVDALARRYRALGGNGCISSVKSSGNIKCYQVYRNFV